MENVRVGVIGFGNMGSAHAKCIFDGNIKGLTSTAICDIDSKRCDKAKEIFQGIAVFEDYKEL